MRGWAPPLLCAFLSTLGCSAIPIAPVAMEPGQALHPGEGFLLLEIDAGEPVERLALQRTDGHGKELEIESLPAGRHLLLLALPSGEYRWRRVQIRRELPPLPEGLRYRRGADILTYEVKDQPELRFSIAADQFNYPGVLVLVWRPGLRWMTISTLNRSGELVEGLLEDHPWVLSERPLIYSGRQRDDYLAAYQKLYLARRGGGGSAPAP